ncbi:MAG: hypothetical protein P8Z79_06800, partial [Sedimentisphaerales bacterium]
MREGVLFRVTLALLSYPLSISAQGSWNAGAPVSNPQAPEQAYATRSSPDAGKSSDLPASAGSDEPLSSASASREFYQIAYELAKPKEVRGPELEQAIIFLTAALELDRTAKSIPPLLIELASRDPAQDHAALVRQMLTGYVDEFADLEVVRKAVGYLLERANSREERERLLKQMMDTLASKNRILGSELATMLGVLKAEKADVQAATSYLLQAYRSNRYNKRAFSKLLEIAPDQVGPAVYLERLRLALRENPVDVDVALAFAEHAEQLQLYDTAAGGYKYCADLFEYLYPSEKLGPQIYLPWAISSYNSRQGQSQCLKIAERVREEGRFDLRLEAIAAKAAIKLGDNELAARTFHAAEQKAVELVNQQDQAASPAGAGSVDSDDPSRVSAEQLAWFYCFALPMPDKALDQAHKAYAADSNSPVAAAMLAYALVMNKQIEWAKPLVDNYEHNQIADLTAGELELAGGQTDLAIATLNTAIASDPGSFAAERAKEILAKQGKEYIPSMPPETVLASLRASFGETLVPRFIPPEKAISAELDIQGDTFPYGDEFSGTVVVTNNSPEPMVISDDGVFKGNIRVDADITGDLTANTPNLVFTKIQAAFLIQPGRSILIPVRLMTGELRRTLVDHPQASLSIEFTLYLDPVLTSGGAIANRLTQIEPYKVRIERPGVKLTTKYLQDRFTSIATDSVEQKIQTAQLFVGLLAEQYAMSAAGKPLYKYLSADWVAPLLKSALTHESGLLLHPGPNEWPVKVATMADMLDLLLDHELIKAAAENLNHRQWPVRLMALYLLAEKQQGIFDKVLDWTIQHDSSPSVRRMAAALATVPS